MTLRLLNRLAVHLSLLIAAVAAPTSASAWVLDVNAGLLRNLYLQVGTGSATGNASNTTVNLVSLTVSGTVNGNGNPLSMTTNSAVASSPLRNAVVCTPPAQMYIGMYYRRSIFLASSPAVLTVNTTTNLTSAAGLTIPFSQISWDNVTSGGAAGMAGMPASGTFSGGSQTLMSLPGGDAVENCLAFKYENDALRGAGTYTGRATYTLTAP